jgi:hypothetical protein
MVITEAAYALADILGDAPTFDAVILRERQLILAVAENIFCRHEVATRAEAIRKARAEAVQAIIDEQRRL